MAGPGIAAGAVPATVARGIDVLPTLLDYAGLGGRPALEGRSLRPAVRGETMADAPAYAESLYPEREFGWAPLHAWRTASFKFIEAPRPELYDLQADPAEATNAFAEGQAKVEDIRAKLAAAIARTGASATATSIRRPRSAWRRSATWAAAASSRVPRPSAAIRRTARGCCRGSIAACRRRARSLSSRSVSSPRCCRTTRGC
jgi:arylsulfatase A-like enzyme